MNKLHFIKQPNKFSCGPTSLVIVLRSFGFVDISLDNFKARKNGYTRNLLIQESNRIKTDIKIYNFIRNHNIEEFKILILFFSNFSNTSIILHYKTFPEHPNGHFSPVIHADEKYIYILDVSRTKTDFVDRMTWKTVFEAVKYRGLIVFSKK
jgi:hypothetical protein